MAVHKNIFWQDGMNRNQKGERFANVHVMVGYNQGSITDLQEMAEELRKTFPQANNNEICSRKVIESSYCYGFTLIIWNDYIPEGDYPGWRQIDNGRMDYCFV